MTPAPFIDRAKHDADVLEHVCRGIQTERAPTAHVQVTDLDVRPWLGGVVVSAVQVEVVPDDEADADSPL